MPLKCPPGYQPYCWDEPNPDCACYKVDSQGNVTDVKAPIYDPNPEPAKPPGPTRPGLRVSRAASRSTPRAPQPPQPPRPPQVPQTPQMPVAVAPPSRGIAKTGLSLAGSPTPRGFRGPGRWR